MLYCPHGLRSDLCTCGKGVRVETIELWALREGVRQIQKQCGKGVQWCDTLGRQEPFDEADAEFWLNWATDVRMCCDAVVGIVDRQMKAPDEPPKPSGPPWNCNLHPACDRGFNHDGACAEVVGDILKAIGS